MKQLKNIIDTVAVMVGKLIELKPMGWKEAQAEAAKMNADVALAKDLPEVDLVDADGKDITTAQPKTPMAYVAVQLVNLACGIAALYIGYLLAKVMFKATLFVVIAGLILAAVMSVYEKFNTKEQKDVPVPSDAATA